MPESAIGLFCDVGVNARLAGVPPHRALLFEFAGLPVGPADAIALDLADFTVAATAVGALRAALVAAASHGAAALREAAADHAADPGPALFCAVADRLAPAFTARTAGGIVAQIAARAGAEHAELLATLGRRCPTSLEAILETYWLAYEDRAVERVLGRDLVLARYLSRRGDFVEGVRAVLVDKDNNPAWDPAAPEDVDLLAIERALGEADQV